MGVLRHMCALFTLLGLWLALATRPSVNNKDKLPARSSACDRSILSLLDLDSSKLTMDSTIIEVGSRFKLDLTHACC